mgnify:CR=1 FL=1
MSKIDDTVELRDRPDFQAFNIRCKFFKIFIFLALKEPRETDRPLIEEEEHKFAASSESQGDYVDFVKEHEISVEKDTVFRSLEI